MPNGRKGLKFSRRELLSTGTAAVVSGALTGSASEEVSAGQFVTGRDQRVAGVKALTFDVFGTVVDWRSSIIREGQLLSASKGLNVDWAKFEDSWRAGYSPAMDRVRKVKFRGLKSTPFIESSSTNYFRSLKSKASLPQRLPSSIELGTGSLLGRIPCPV